jgi:biopolymer transport protein ExbB
MIAFWLHSLQVSAAFLVKGGIVMIPIVSGSFIAGALILERLWFYRKIRCDPEQLTAQVYPLVQKRQFTEALTACQQFRGPVPKLFQLVIENQRRSVEELEHLSSIAGTRELQALSQYLRTLGFIGQIEPLLGFLGTVFGMITTFMQVATLQGHVNPSLLAGGIWEALITTAAGLVVAIPVVMMTHHFEGLIDNTAMQMKNYTQELITLVKYD